MEELEERRDEVTTELAQIRSAMQVGACPSACLSVCLSVCPYSCSTNGSIKTRMENVYMYIVKSQCLISNTMDEFISSFDTQREQYALSLGVRNLCLGEDRHGRSYWRLQVGRLALLGYSGWLGQWLCLCLKMCSVYVCVFVLVRNRVLLLHKYQNTTAK